MQATLKQIREFFGMETGEFTQAWRNLTDKDKTDLKDGIGNGSLTY